MDKIICDGEVFFVDKGVVYDQNFLEVPLCISSHILNDYFSKIEYNAFGETQILDFIKQTKLAKKYHKCLEVIEYAISNISLTQDFYTKIFPIVTSCYRALKQPQKAIDFWMKNKKVFNSCLSVPLLTSLAAAYCDLNKYDLAKTCADRAYAMQGGNKSYKTELTMVYERIRKENK